MACLRIRENKEKSAGVGDRDRRHKLTSERFEINVLSTSTSTLKWEASIASIWLELNYLKKQKQTAKLAKRKKKFI
ncbi:hypothetical protein I7I50_07168 [Histoplasma capsulatum G186AR]|uniref:Uncharacterized protein n=1 Tax=Ajellomyces capsulatus TaxID=5037 RepID=A0A8H8D2L4_AJECA|nr:hypothetical protein I7I52_09762 [Histoplasma capsulatum]QSS67935.1 hypothetical protein I7I50_07168 [Histoplasma capsulatum G186AR]